MKVRREATFYTNISRFLKVEVILLVVSGGGGSKDRPSQESGKYDC